MAFLERIHARPAYKRALERVTIFGWALTLARPVESRGYRPTILPGYNWRTLAPRATWF